MTDSRLFTFGMVWLVFIPYFNFGLTKSEVIPLYLVFILFLLKKRLKFIDYFVLAMLSLIFILSLFSFDISLTQSLTTFLAVISPLFLFYYSRFLNSNIIISCIRVITYILFFIGILQTFAPSILDVTKINYLFSLLIERYSGVELGGEASRGIRLIAPEPSYAVYTLLGLLISTTCFYKIGKNQTDLVCIFLLLFLLILVKSATGILGIALYLLSLAISSKKFFINLSKLVISVFILLSVIAPFLTIENYRFYLVLIRLYEMYNSGSSLLSAYSILDSGRLLSVFVGYQQLMDFSLPQFGSWSVNFSNELNQSGFSFDEVYFLYEVAGNIKPFSWGATLAFDMKLLSILFFCPIFYSLIELYARGRNGKRRVNNIKFLAPCFFIFFSSPVSLPIFWFVISIDYNNFRTRDLNLNMIKGSDSA